MKKIWFEWFSSIGHQKKSTLDLTWCTSYIPMKQTLFIANVLSSNCGMYFFLDQIWVCVYFSWWYAARPPLIRSKSYLSNRKTHSGNYKSTCCQYNTSIYLIKFKKRSIWPSNFGALALVPRSQKKNPDMGRQYCTHSSSSVTTKQTFNCA